MPIERYVWPLATGLLLLLLAHLARAFRPAARPAAAAALFAIALLSTEGTASAGDAAEAFFHYQEGEFDAAAEKYSTALAATDDAERAAKLQLGLGASALGAGDLEEAVEAFGWALLSEKPDTQQTAHYNLGWGLYRIGDRRISPPEAPPSSEGAPAAPPAIDPDDIARTLEDWLAAIDHFEAVLEFDPNHTEANENIEFIKERIKELEQQQEQQQQQEQEGEEEQENQEQEDNEDAGDQGQDGQPSEDEGEEQGGEGQEPQEDEGEQSSEQGEGGEEKSESAQAGEGEEQAEGASDDGQPTEEEMAQQAQASEGDPDQEVNEETGYSIEQALRALNAMASDEKNLKRPKRRARAKYYKDW